MTEFIPDSLIRQQAAVGALVAFGVLLVILVAYRGGGHRAGDAPWWAWVGGILGAFYVTSSIVVAPRLGSAAFFGILVAAQLVMSVLIDRYGLLGYAKHETSPGRLVGVVLLVTGAVLVRLF